jgi:hypothetical protein
MVRFARRSPPKPGHNSTPVCIYHFLVSNQSRYITGHTFVVDGGRLAGMRQDALARLVDCNGLSGSCRPWPSVPPVYMR